RELRPIDPSLKALPLKGLLDCRSLSGFFAALFFFLLRLFELLLEFGALLALDVGPLLALHFELLLGSEQFDERCLAAVALSKSSPDDAEIAPLPVAVAR